MGDALLSVVEGPDAGRQVRVSGPLEIGRDAAAQLVLEDPLVSRRHARLIPDAQGATIEDLGSTNGTFIDQVQIHAPSRLLAGQHVLVGTTVLALSVDGPPAPIATVPPALARGPSKPEYVPRELAGDLAVPELQSLFDRRIKRRARLAPLAIFVLAAFVVMIWLALR